jgi:hypothetical protein
VVLHTGYQNDIVVFYRAMREANWRPRMVIGSGAGYSGVDTMRAVGPDFDGTMNVDFTQFEVNERMAPGVKQFVEAYRRRYGSEPRSGHSLANYCGARICLDAVQRAGGLEADRVRAAMLATDLPDGARPRAGAPDSTSGARTPAPGPSCCNGRTASRSRSSPPRRRGAVAGAVRPGRLRSRRPLGDQKGGGQSGFCAFSSNRAKKPGLVLAPAAATSAAWRGLAASRSPAAVFSLRSNQRSKVSPAFAARLAS